MTQIEVDRLLGLAKRLAKDGELLFPGRGERASYDLVSTDGRERFIADVNRGRFILGKCTYQERYNVTEVLLRLDVDGPPHENPDGSVMRCPPLHVWRADASDKWAIELPEGTFPPLSDPVATLRDFLAYCNVTHIPSIVTEMF